MHTLCDYSMDLTQNWFNKRLRYAISTYMYVVTSLYMHTVIYSAMSKRSIANILLTIKRFYGYVCHFFALQVARLLYSEHSHCLDANIFALDLLFVCDIGDLSLLPCSRDCWAYPVYCPTMQCSMIVTQLSKMPSQTLNRYGHFVIWFLAFNILYSSLNSLATKATLLKSDKFCRDYVLLTHKTIHCSVTTYLCIPLW